MDWPSFLMNVSSPSKVSFFFVSHLSLPLPIKVQIFKKNEEIGTYVCKLGVCQWMQVFWDVSFPWWKINGETPS